MILHVNVITTYILTLYSFMIQNISCNIEHTHLRFMQQVILGKIAIDNNFETKILHYFVAMEMFQIYQLFINSL